MVTPIFPSALPGVERFVLKPEGTVIADENDGPKVYRRRSSMPHANGQVSWKFLENDLTVFNTFCRTTLLGFHKWFWMKLPSAGGITWHLIRFRDKPSWRMVGFNAWGVDATIELLTRAFETQPDPPTEPDPEPPGDEPMYLFHFQADEFVQQSVESGLATDQIDGEWTFKGKLKTSDSKFGEAGYEQNLFPEENALTRTSTNKFERLGRDFTILDCWIFVNSDIYDDIESTVSAPLLIVETQKSDETAGSNIIIDLRFSPDFGELSIRVYPQDDSTTPVFKTFFADELLHLRVSFYFVSEDEGQMKIWIDGQSFASAPFNPNSINEMAFIGPSFVFGPFEEFTPYFWIDEAFGQLGALNAIDVEEFSVPTEEWPPSDIHPPEFWLYNDVFSDGPVSITGHVPTAIPEGVTGWQNSDPSLMVVEEGGVGAVHSGLSLTLNVAQPPADYPDTVLEFRWDHREPAPEAIATIFGFGPSFLNMFKVDAYSQDYPGDAGKVELFLPLTEGASLSSVGTATVDENGMLFTLIVSGSNVQLWADADLIFDYDLSYDLVKYPNDLFFSSDGGQVDGSDVTYLTQLTITLTDDHLGGI